MNYAGEIHLLNGHKLEQPAMIADHARRQRTNFHLMRRIHEWWKIIPLIRNAYLVEAGRCQIIIRVVFALDADYALASITDRRVFQE